MKDSKFEVGDWIKVSGAPVTLKWKRAYRVKEVFPATQDEIDIVVLWGIRNETQKRGGYHPSCFCLATPGEIAAVPLKVGDWAMCKSRLPTPGEAWRIKQCDLDNDLRNPNQRHNGESNLWFHATPEQYRHATQNEEKAMKSAPATSAPEPDSPLTDSTAGWDPPEAAELLEKIAMLEAKHEVVIARLEAAAETRRKILDDICALKATPVPTPPDSELLYDRITGEGPMIRVKGEEVDRYGQGAYYTGASDKTEAGYPQTKRNVWPNTLSLKPPKPALVKPKRRKVAMWLRPLVFFGTLWAIAVASGWGLASLIDTKSTSITREPQGSNLESQ